MHQDHFSKYTFAASTTFVIFAAPLTFWLDLLCLLYQPEFWPNGLGGRDAHGKWKPGFAAYSQWFDRVARALNPCGTPGFLSGPGWGEFLSSIVIITSNLSFTQLHSSCNTSVMQHCTHTTVLGYAVSPVLLVTQFKYTLSCR